MSDKPPFGLVHNKGDVLIAPELIPSYQGLKKIRLHMPYPLSKTYNNIAANEDANSSVLHSAQGDEVTRDFSHLIETLPEIGEITPDYFEHMIRLPVFNWLKQQAMDSAYVSASVNAAIELENAKQIQRQIRRKLQQEVLLLEKAKNDPGKKFQQRLQNLEEVGKEQNERIQRLQEAIREETQKFNELTKEIKLLESELKVYDRQEQQAVDAINNLIKEWPKKEAQYMRDAGKKLQEQLRDNPINFSASEPPADNPLFLDKDNNPRTEFRFKPGADGVCKWNDKRVQDAIPDALQLMNPVDEEGNTLLDENGNPAQNLFERLNEIDANSEDSIKAMMDAKNAALKAYKEAKGFDVHEALSEESVASADKDSAGRTAVNLMNFRKDLFRHMVIVKGFGDDPKSVQQAAMVRNFTDVVGEAMSMQARKIFEADVEKASRKLDNVRDRRQDIAHKLSKARTDLAVTGEKLHAKVAELRVDLEAPNSPDLQSDITPQQPGQGGVGN